MRFSEEQIEYHYTRDRRVLTKALLRRGCVPASAAALGPATAYVDPSLQAYHSATMAAAKAVQLKSPTVGAA